MSGFNQTKQYSRAPIGRYTISLRKNRTNGENFPAFEGEFFYVESVDLPCRVCFNGSDDSQSVGLSSGFQLNMPFSGITIFHDDYSTAGSATQSYLLTVYISRDPRAFNQYVNPSTQVQLPFLSAGVVVPNYSCRFPIFPRTRFLNHKAYVVVTKATDPMGAINYYQFYDADGNVISGPSGVTKNGITYPSSGIISPSNVLAKAVSPSVWAYDINNQNILIPSGADNVLFIINWWSAGPGLLVAEQHFASIS